MLDALLGDSCSFANTLQSLTVEVYCLNSSKWKDEQFEEEILHDHVIPHWKFPFPNLQSCYVDLQIGDFLITKRLLANCPALHTLDDWKVMRHEHAIIFKNENMRMRQRYLKCFGDCRLKST